MPNNYRTPYSKLIGALKNSATKKHHAGWSRAVGAGFIAEDINDVRYISSKEQGLYKGESRISFGFTWGRQTIPIGDLNLRETEEALKWAEKKEAQWEYKQRKEKWN